MALVKRLTFSFSQKKCAWDDPKPKTESICFIDRFFSLHHNRSAFTVCFHFGAAAHSLTQKEFGCLALTLFCKLTTDQKEKREKKRFAKKNSVKGYLTCAMFYNNILFEILLVCAYIFYFWPAPIFLPV